MMTDMVQSPAKTGVQTMTEWITVAEAAEIMDVAVSNVRYLCKHGKITCQKFGRAWQVSKEDAENYVRSNRDPDWLYTDADDK